MVEVGAAGSGASWVGAQSPNMLRGGLGGGDGRQGGRWVSGRGGAWRRRRALGPLGAAEAAQNVKRGGVGGVHYVFEGRGLGKGAGGDGVRRAAACGGQRCGNRGERVGGWRSSGTRGLSHRKEGE